MIRAIKKAEDAHNGTSALMLFATGSCRENSAAHIENSNINQKPAMASSIVVGFTRGKVRWLRDPNGPSRREDPGGRGSRPVCAYGTKATGAAYREWVLHA